MDIEKLKLEVIHSENTNRLYELIIDITSRISTLHIALTRTVAPIAKTEIKGEISIYNALLTIANKRIDDLRSLSTEQERKEFYSNRQFRMIAETVLRKETYSRIKELCALNYKEFKDQRSELKAQKME